MTLTYRRVGTSVVPALRPPDRAYAAMDESGRLMAVVAGSGRSWWAGPISPSRTRIPSWTVRAETREAAALLMVRGRP